MVEDVLLDLLPVGCPEARVEQSNLDAAVRQRLKEGKEGSLCLADGVADDRRTAAVREGRAEFSSQCLHIEPPKANCRAPCRLDGNLLDSFILAGQHAR